MENKSQQPIFSQPTVLEYQSRKNYGGSFQMNGEIIKCYTKKQIKSLYPGKDYELAAELAPGGKKAVTGLLDGKKNRRLFKAGTHSRLLFREKGFVAVEPGEDRYVALLQNVFVPRIIALVLCLALIAGGTVFALNMNKAPVTASLQEENVPAGKQPELEEGAVDWEGVQPQNTGGVTPGIAIPGYKSITIDAGKADVKVNFSNPAGNPCYFEISLLLDDGTELYKSKMIEPGKGLYAVTLNQPVKKGKYNATVKYNTFSLEGLAPMNGAEVKIVLIAQ